MAAVGLQGDNVNIMLVIMCNWLVIDRAPFLYRLPGIIKEIPLYITVSYVMGNLIFLGVGYVLYVEQKAQKLTGKKKKTEMTPENEKEEQLAEFTRRKEKENRLELLFVVTLISNAVLLVAIGVIPIRDVLNGIGHTLKMVLVKE
ncbi:hypothetical protein AGDE_03907 [Angomonas deanei]|uniref:Uncharacterized protein n=1 Tax=Angomonas deanei TaxID=59799 RepID=A0A7G2CL53_9TRYP|nr:hypothetical protein AGDE_03907 [Angomonas deanei]CAD2220145.1 hypothetical protein, conserved [Angomonas deanei]|eukprot:EPY40021.1 hypothetical protein AGDE_03907 [Angomonas deanei]